MKVLQELRGVLRLRPLQLLALSCLMAGLVGINLLTKTSVRDPDMWWHLKVGDWIIQNHAVPHVGIFSRTAGTHPWIAYSWGYEVLLSLSYAWFGLVGVASFGVLLTLAVAGTFFWMLHRLSGKFWVAWSLSLVGSFAFLYSLMPRPVFFSMALFTITLTAILEAHRSGRVQLLYWLPLIFLVWANLHIQFIYGLFLFGLFVGVNVLQHLASRVVTLPGSLVRPSLSPRMLLGILLGSVLASCVGPYSFRLYQVVFEYSKSQVSYFIIQELQPIDFGNYTNYFVLLLAVAAFFALGWQKKLDCFKFLLLIAATVAAFRTRRDIWFLAVPAAAFLAELAADENERQRTRLKLAELAGVAAMVTASLLLIAGNTGFNARGLDLAVSREYPVDAVNFLRRNPVPGPLYNSFDWGGFLIWYMPEYPVAIDGRNDLYGDEVDLLTFRSVGGSSYDSDPYLNEAGVVLLPKKVPLTTMLSVDPRFRMIYQDRLSVVFVRQSS